MPLPTDSTHLSDVDTSLLLDQYGGGVESQFTKDSVMRMFVPVRSVTRTDTIVNNRVGRTTLQKLVAGVRPDASVTGFGKVQLTIDTVILARDNRSMLNEFQTHFEARAELAKDHGKELAKFFDQAFLIQAIKGAGLSAPSGLNSAIGAGKSVSLSGGSDHLDPDKLYTGIASVLVSMEEEDIDISECVVFVRPTQYDVLLNNDKLVDKQFSEGGDFAAGRFPSIKGCRVISTARIPTSAISGHKLSNAGNSNAYDVSSTEAKTVTVIMHPKSLLAGETIPLQSDIWFSKEEKQWFIDSFIAFGVTPNRPDCCGRVLKA